MVDTLQLQCKGPNQRVEHTENMLCFVSSLVGVQVRQRRCMRNIFVPRKHHKKSRKYHGNATENHGKSRKTTENHGKSRKITEGFFQANHGNSRSPGGGAKGRCSVATDTGSIYNVHGTKQPRLGKCSGRSGSSSVSARKHGCKNGWRRQTSNDSGAGRRRPQQSE